MKLKSIVFVATAIYSLASQADEPASSKPLPKLENEYAGQLCGHFDTQPAGPQLVDESIARIKLTHKDKKLYNPIAAKRVATAYAYRDRDRGGDCWANVQDEYWAPKNQPK